MARKRMIDPQFWESAFGKNWTTEDCILMMAAISFADDEGRGRISTLLKNTSSMISEKKFYKSLEKLNDSITIYEKIYYFLPNWLQYQTINRPTPSKYPKPSILENNELAPKESLSDHTSINEDSLPSKSKLREEKLKESKLSKENENNDTYFDKKTSSPTPTEPNLYEPEDFENDGQLKTVIRYMLTDFCKIKPDKSEIGRYLKIITSTPGCSRRTAHRITLETCKDFASFEQKKRNLAYLSTVITGRINDGLIKHREALAKTDKVTEAKETKEFEQLLTENAENEDLEDLSSLLTDYKINHKV